MEEKKRIYNLEERTAKFGEDIIKFCNKMPNSPVISPIKTQLTKAGTSVGANYSEADDAESGNDFCHKIAISKKEARESKHFLRMSAVAYPTLKDEAKVLWQEANELNLIFNKIYKTIKSKKS